MQVLPAKDRDKRTEQELRLQPFTLLACVPVALLTAAAITYTVVYSDDPNEVRSHALLSSCLVIPAIIVFALVWRKEARRPFSLRARRIAWWIMFGGYLTFTFGGILLAILFRASGSKLSGLVTFVVLGIPIGLVLFRLSTTHATKG